MPRATKGAARKRSRKRLLNKTEGYWGGRGNLYRKAMETYIRAMVFSFRDRKARKRKFRELWISRINAAVRERGMSYSRFISGLVKANVDLNRKMLAEMAVNDKPAFDKLVEQVKAAAG
ncbi:MAG: 50S ribosomal protein L20 [Candidatus Jettenia sp.]|uniref:Large ribosomal subunit protein bL20 n=1 Tax=Candidatus Jettenia caeni TaxID=247490 RepID=I3IMJ0_9BACT|nr:50S ribosomal protein L20 [Candidatus Jettenia sp. AMX1]MBC6928803.1 50S ribosomal protein L20 [Candidatus Jettenia sp.]NUN23948.1 50S ribosomal protein L20 [Candidatus Jettenia caeni]WKZ18203.1 MAG: 50S ribosomal protein L20 [Candidatus Jettenia sp. CY-1]KAA0250773.1 MAG: 50S ribosomal protein L20 [Candidatus Jettenia sp. AMX1]MCE7880115.1 50S ribosomal protein L20 [Candidatus Jettenia sp. AMX1]